MKGILFKDEMVRAIMEKRKRMTRRILNPQPMAEYDRPQVQPDGRAVFLDMGHANPYDRAWEIKCPYSPGEIVYVKETWGYATGPVDGSKPDASNSAIIYREEWDRECPKAPLTGAWKSPLFLPAWAARIFLRITAVSVERVQSITGDDAVAEGVDLTNPARLAGMEWDKMRRMQFARLWDSIHAKDYPWESNCYVWKICFERVAKPGTLAGEGE